MKKSEVNPNRITKRFIYQIFMGKFAKDFIQLRESLNYVKTIGFDDIMLSPICIATSYHGYDTKDYKEVNPDFGNLDDFKDLMRYCENNDIKVYLDMVFCHTSTEHKWFIDSRKGLNDFYIWCDTLPDKDYWYPTPMNECSWQYDDVSGKYYLSCWGKGMPCLNIHSINLKREIRDIITFWASISKNICFRLDAVLYADLIYGKAIDYCRFIRECAESVNPDIEIVGEVWDDYDTYEYFAKVLGGAFNFDFAAQCKSAANEGKDVDFAIGDSNMYDFISNHDMSRLCNSLQYDENKIVNAFKNLIHRGKGKRVVIYYGDEIGTTGEARGVDHSDVRREMDWDEVNRQFWDPCSILSRIQRLIRLYKEK